jgi:hypothetical protein
MEMVNGDTLPWLGGGKNKVLVLWFLDPQSNLRHGPSKAACAPWHADACKLLWDLTVEDKLSELHEGNMA